MLSSIVKWISSSGSEPAKMKKLEDWEYYVIENLHSVGEDYRNIASALNISEVRAKYETKKIDRHRQCYSVKQ